MLNQLDVFPLFGLNQTAHVILLVSIGIIGSIIAVFLFPRFFCPLFLKIKGIIRKRYKNAYIQYEPYFFAKNKILRRVIYLFLLNIGFLVILLPLINPVLFLSKEFGVEYYEGELGGPAEYTSGVLIGLTCLLNPIIVGLWSIGWAMEDAGLMHYKFDTRSGRELYEIEPIHLNYSNVLKGYAGISSIIFIIQVAIAWASVTVESRITDVIWRFYCQQSVLFYQFLHI